MRALAAVAILLLASLPVGSAAEGTWSLDARVLVLSETTADYTWTLTGLENVALTLPIPTNATFVETRDAQGRIVQTETSEHATLGPAITVHIGRSPPTIKFSLKGTKTGPFVSFPVQIAADDDTPVQIAVALPSGWSLPGYRSTPAMTPDAQGRFEFVGRAYVQYVALPPGIADPGPVPGIGGDRVVRAGSADISMTGTRWNVTITYDTNVFGETWRVDLPPGASVRAAGTPLGPLTTSVEGDEVVVRTGYPFAMNLGARPFYVEMTLPPPTSKGGAFAIANLSLPAADGDRVVIDARLADGLRYAGAITPSREPRPLRYEYEKGFSMSLALLPPPAPGHVQFTEGAFIVDAPATLEPAARATARNASALLPIAASFAADALGTRPFYVSYTDADIFHWEKGFYSNGHNTISIRASTLANVTDAAPHLTPVSILIHEATHGLVDRRLQNGPDDVSLLQEGLARLAEARLDPYFPAETVSCTSDAAGRSCEIHSARANAARVQAFHREGRALDVAWKASTVADDETRVFLYDYSGLVFLAFDARAPQGALDNLIAHLAAREYSDDASAQAQVLIDLMLANAPGASTTAILYPGRESASLTPEQFRACMDGLLAPPFPWEPVATPPQGGCPPTGYGARQGPLPTAPVQESPPTETTPTPATLPTRLSPPTAMTPPVFSPDDDAPAGARVEDEGTIGEGIAIPGAAAWLVLAAALVVALAIRRR